MSKTSFFIFLQKNHGATGTGTCWLQVAAAAEPAARRGERGDARHARLEDGHVVRGAGVLHGAARRLVEPGHGRGVRAVAPQGLLVPLQVPPELQLPQHAHLGPAVHPRGALGGPAVTIVPLMANLSLVCSTYCFVSKLESFT